MGSPATRQRTAGEQLITANATRKIVFDVPVEDIWKKASNTWEANTRSWSTSHRPTIELTESLPHVAVQHSENTRPIALVIYCRDLKINDRRALAAKGPLLIAANHPNSFPRCDHYRHLYSISPFIHWRVAMHLPTGSPSAC